MESALDRPIARFATGRRKKRRARRLARDLRLYGPMLAVGLQTLVLALTILVVERLHERAPVVQVDQREFASAYLTSISSTSKVSAAPPGITGGAPLSP